VLRWLFRAIGLFCLAGAFAAAVLDGARSIADQKLALTPLGVTLATAFPAKFPLLPALVAKVHPLLWDPVLLSVLYVPTSIDLAVVGLVLFAFSGARSARR